jgi:hypothetical protein
VLKTQRQFKASLKSESVIFKTKLAQNPSKMMQIWSLGAPWLANSVNLIPIKMSRKQKRYGSSTLNSQKSSVSAKQSVKQPSLPTESGVNQN